MAKYIVSYDTTTLNQNDRTPIYQKLDKFLIKYGIKIQGSVWIIDTTSASVEIRDVILNILTITERKHIDVLVSEIVKTNCAAQILDYKIKPVVKKILPSCNIV